MRMMVVVRTRCGADGGRMVVAGRTVVGDLRTVKFQREREREKGRGSSGGRMVTVVVGGRRWYEDVGCGSVQRET